MAAQVGYAAMLRCRPARVDVQKKQRSDVMSSINKKFSFISQNEQPIIDKTRTDIDKRSFEYFIANERLAEVKAVISTM